MSSAQNPATARIGKGSGSPSSFSDLQKQPLQHRTALIARLVRLMLVASALLLLPDPGRGVTVFGSGAAEKRIPDVEELLSRALREAEVHILEYPQ